MYETEKFILLGIHRGGGATLTGSKNRTNGSARSVHIPSTSVSSSRRTSSCHNRNYIGNGINGKDRDVTSVCNR